MWNFLFGGLGQIFESTKKETTSRITDWRDSLRESLRTIRADRVRESPIGVLRPFGKLVFGEAKEPLSVPRIDDFSMRSIHAI